MFDCLYLVLDLQSFCDVIDSIFDENLIYYNLNLHNRFSLKIESSWKHIQFQIKYIYLIHLTVDENIFKMANFSNSPR